MYIDTSCEAMEISQLLSIEHFRFTQVCYQCMKDTSILYKIKLNERYLCEKCAQSIPLTYDFYVDTYWDCWNRYRYEITNIKLANHVMDSPNPVFPTPLPTLNILNEYLIKHKL